jgi:hypothetical protein
MKPIGVVRRHETFHNASGDRETRRSASAEASRFSDLFTAFAAAGFESKGDVT